MRYLLDTHVILWEFMNSPRRPQKIIDIISNPNNEIFVSITSIWEITIKIAAGKLDLSFPKLLNTLKAANYKYLAVSILHLTKILDLPMIHKDPFDRLLIATAMVEGLTIATIDENIQKYDVEWIW